MEKDLSMDFDESENPDDSGVISDDGISLQLVVLINIRHSSQ